MIFTANIYGVVELRHSQDTQQPLLACHCRNAFIACITSSASLSISQRALLLKTLYYQSLYFFPYHSCRLLLFLELKNKSFHTKPEVDLHGLNTNLSSSNLFTTSFSFPFKKTCYQYVTLFLCSACQHWCGTINFPVNKNHPIFFSWPLWNAEQLFQIWIRIFFFFPNKDCVIQQNPFCTWQTV